MKKIILVLILIAVYSICQAKTWQAYDLYTTPADADHLMLNDTDDPTDNAAGTLKRLAWLYVQQRDADLTSIAALSTTAYGRALLEMAQAANGKILIGNGTDTPVMALMTETGDALAISVGAGTINFVPHANIEDLTDGILAYPLYFDDGFTNSPGMRWVDETDEYWHLYKIDASNLHLYTIHADDQTFQISNEGAGDANLSVDGVISEAGGLLSVTYHALEDQGVSTTDDVEFNTVTITAGESASGGFEIDNMPDVDHTCQGILTTGTAGAENMAFGEIVTVANATGKWILANANSTGVLEARGINCNQGIDTDTDDPILVMLTGYIRDDTWDFTDDINKDMLLDETAGDMVLADGAIPADTGDIIQIIGYVTDHHMVGTEEAFYFNPQPVFSVLE